MTRQLSAGEAPLIRAHGPKAEYVPTTDLAVPATVAASSTWTSAVQSADGYYDLVVGVTLSQAGSLKVQRYIDDAGTVPLAVADTQALTAATPGVLVINDGKPFASYTVSIQNTSVSLGNVTGFAALASAH